MSTRPWSNAINVPQAIEARWRAPLEQDRTAAAVATSTEIVTDRRRFLAIRAAWDELAAASGTPLASHDWFLAALDANASAVGLFAILLWQGDRLVAAAPFGVERKGLARRLVPIDAFAGEPNDLLYADEHALRQLAAIIARQRRSLLIRRLPARGPVSLALAEAFRGQAPILQPINGRCAFVELGGGFLQLELQMSGNRRSAIKRKQKNAGAALGPMRVELLAPEPGQVDAALDRFTRIEGSGWKGADRTSIDADPRMARFIRKLAWRFAASGELRIIFLCFGGRELAARMMLEGRRTWWEIKIGYNEAYSRFSPGILLMHETLRAASEVGVERYEFLGSHEAWEEQWPCEVRDSERFAAYWPGLNGLGAAISDAIVILRGQFNRLRRKLPA